MAKSLSAADMLGSTRRAMKDNLNESPKRLEAETPSGLDAHSLAGRARNDEGPSRLDVEPPSRRGAQAAGLVTAPRYEKASIFLRPDQRAWLRQTARSLPDGLSGSDVVRLALDELQQATERGFELIEVLSRRAYAEAEQFEGRRNRGLPPQEE